jgi:hypothetical protein
MNTRARLLTLVFLLAGLISACEPDGLNEKVSLSTPAPTSVWSLLLEITPVPYASPLPESNQTPIDGTYANFDPAPPQWWACLRCADYRPAGGVWRLQFDRGVMRIYYEVTGWKSLASYSVMGDRLYLFNDPYCKEATGEYKWDLVDGKLALEVIDDPCSFQLRGKNLSLGTWEGCPAGNEADIEQLRGCTDPSAEPITIPSLPDGLNVTVHQADVRLSDPTPDKLVNANGLDQSLPDGVHLSYSDDSMLYGTNRVLWKDDDWAEITTDAPFASIGVQFRGSYVIGWARVLFDGEEIWRGDTTKIWAEKKVHGGYIEISGFEPGEHTLRVERLEIDSRPVIVSFFGFHK